MCRSQIPARPLPCASISLSQPNSRIIAPLAAPASPTGGNIDQMRFRPRCLPNRFLSARNFSARPAAGAACTASVSACISRCSIATSSMGNKQRMPFRRIRQRSLNGRSSSSRSRWLYLSISSRVGQSAGLSRRQSTSDGIDSERKQFIERFVEGLQPKRALRQQIPIERLYMSDVKNNSMPFCNRPVVHRLVRERCQTIRRCACAPHARRACRSCRMRTALLRLPCDLLPTLGCRFRLKDAPKFVPGSAERV